MQPAFYRSYQDVANAFGPLSSSPAVFHGAASETESDIYALGGRDSLTLDILEMDHIQTFANSGHIHLRLREPCELIRRGRRPCHDSDEEGARFYGCDPREGDHPRRVDTFPALAAPRFTLLVSGIEPEILVAFDAASPDNGWPPCSKF